MRPRPSAGLAGLRDKLRSFRAFMLRRVGPAQKWRHLWPSAVAGWAGNSHPRPPVFAPKRNAGRLLYLGYRTRCATFDHALPDSVVLGPHSTWPWMAVPLWTPDAVNHVENLTIRLIDEFFEIFVRDRLNKAMGVFVKKSGGGANML